MDRFHQNLPAILYALAYQCEDRPISLRHIEQACEAPLLLENRKVYARNVSGWHFYHDTLQDAMECLETEGLIPPDDERRFFVHPCGRCERGTVVNQFNEPESCEICEGTDTRFEKYPVSFHALVAWAGISIPRILQAEELAREGVRRLIDFGWAQSETIAWGLGDKRIPISIAILATSAGSRERGEEVPTLEQESPIRTLQEMGIGIDDIREQGIALVIPPVV